MRTRTTLDLGAIQLPKESVHPWSLNLPLIRSILIHPKCRTAHRTQRPLMHHIMEVHRITVTIAIHHRPNIQVVAIQDPSSTVTVSIVIMRRTVHLRHHRIMVDLEHTMITIVPRRTMDSTLLRLITTLMNRNLHLIQRTRMGIRREEITMVTMIRTLLTQVTTGVLLQVLTMNMTGIITTTLTTPMANILTTITTPRKMKSQA